MNRFIARIFQQQYNLVDEMTALGTEPTSIKIGIPDGERDFLRQ